MIKLHDHVTALVGVASAGVVAGAVGVVIEAYQDGSFDVEFEPDTDENLIVAAMTADQLSLAPEALHRAA